LSIFKSYCPDKVQPSMTSMCDLDFWGTGLESCTHCHIMTYMRSYLKICHGMLTLWPWQEIMNVQCHSHTDNILVNYIKLTANKLDKSGLK